MGIITGQNLQSVGMAASAKGCLDLVSGRFVEGATMLLTGLTVMAADAKLNFLNRVDLSNLVKFSIFSGVAAAAVQGGFRFVDGIKQHNSIELLKGAFQTAVGAIVGSFVSTLDSRVVMIAHQAAIITLSSALTTRLGYFDIKKGCYVDGLYKLLIGAVGFAGAAYHTQNLMRENFITDEMLIFLENHNEEIESIRRYPRALGDWKNIGLGTSKNVFEHPKLSGKVIKLAKNEGPYGNVYLNFHHLNLESMRKIAETPDFDRIFLPQTQIYQPVRSKRGSCILIEEKISPLKFSTVPDSDEKRIIIEQLHHFLYRAHLRDVRPEIDHNAGIINDGGNLKMAIYDADSGADTHLVLPQEGNWDWITDNRKNTLIVSLIYATQLAYFAFYVNKICSNLDNKISSERFNAYYITIPVAMAAIYYVTNQILIWAEGDDPYSLRERNDIVLSLGAAMFSANVAMASFVVIANKVSRLFQS